MVRRGVWFLLVMAALAWPAAAQDFSTLDISFGYANYGVADSLGEKPQTDRVHGFAMHTSINVMRWLSFENYTGAYSMKDDITLFTNTFGLKIVGRDVLDGRISPYVAAGFGFGYYTSNRSGGGLSMASTRYAVGMDFNLSPGMALRFDVGGLGVSKGVVGGFIRDSWNRSTNFTTGIVFNLGG